MRVDDREFFCLVDGCPRCFGPIRNSYLIFVIVYIIIKYVYIVYCLYCIIIYLYILCSDDNRVSYPETPVDEDTKP